MYRGERGKERGVGGNIFSIWVSADGWAGRHEAEHAGSGILLQRPAHQHPGGAARQTAKATQDRALPAQGHIG